MYISWLDSYLESTLYKCKKLRTMKYKNLYQKVKTLKVLQELLIENLLFTLYVVSVRSDNKHCHWEQFSQ